MNLEALGNLGDFLGGIGVIVTLIYLAVQIRQNTAQLRRNERYARNDAIDETVRGFNGFRLLLAGDAELASIWSRGLADPDSLDETEGVRFDLLRRTFTYTHQANIMRIGSVDPEGENLELMRVAFQEVLRTPGFETWWKRNRGRFMKQFVATVDADANPEEDG